MHPSSSPLVVPLRADRWPEVAALQARCFPTPWDEKALRDLLASAWCRSLGAEDPSSKALLGYALFVRQDELCHLLDLAVNPAWRRQGMGSGLVAAVSADARALGATTLFLEVRLHNATARAFYRHLRFVCTGRKPAYYPDTGEDALVLGKEIGQPGSC